MKFLEENVLYLFCDASIVKLNNGVTLGCPGVIVSEFTNGELIEKYSRYKLIYETTNNNSEISAILLGVLEAIKHQGQYNKIRLISDSLICIMGLREWIFNWINCINNGIMYSSSMQPVANQDVIITIIQTIINNNLNIELYHQKGHVTTTKASLENAKKVFYRDNHGILLSDEEIKSISIFNDKIDKLTKEVLSENLNNYSIRRQLLNPIVYSIENCDFDKYKSLITHK